ncbi:hypothetical protein ACTHGU_06225 [Chitinophagaceae bacterium MMS25-I14]
MSKKQDEAYSVSAVREWLTILDELRQENIRLQDRLSATIKDEVSRTFIEDAEAFQQKFIDKDQVINLLRYDIAGLLKQMQLPVQANIRSILQARQLEKDLHKVISRFNLLKDSFDKYLTEAGKLTQH